MIVGPFFETLRQIGKSAKIKQKIQELQNVANSEVIDLVKPEFKIQAKLLLKQAEHFEKSKTKTPRILLSNLEKEIINLMDQHIKDKKEELAKKNATQLDVAKILKTIQQLSSETADEISQISSDLNITEAKQTTALANLDKYVKNLNREIENLHHEIQMERRQNRKTTRLGIIILSIVLASILALNIVLLLKL